MFIAFAHIVGALIVVFALSCITLWIAGWEIERNKKREQEEIALHLGVAVADLDNQELYPKLVHILSERFSSELFRNRLSDLAGVIRSGWFWIGNLIQLIVLGTTIWQTFSEELNNAVFAWFLVAISIFFWGSSVVFSLICRLLTGRYPGQAKEARKCLAGFLHLNRVKI